MHKLFTWPMKITNNTPPWWEILRRTPVLILCAPFYLLGWCAEWILSAWAGLTSGILDGIRTEQHAEWVKRFNDAREKDTP